MAKLRKKYSLIAQIAEVKRELALRGGVYPGRVAAGKMRESEAEMHVDIMANVLDTLQWLEKHESIVKAAVRKATGDAGSEAPPP